MTDFSTAGFWLALLQIIGLNLILSGDNAAVIALASKDLDPVERRWAVWLGGFGGVLLRVLLTVGAVQVLAWPYVQTLGALLLFWVAWRLVAEPPQRGSPHNNAPASAQRLSQTGSSGLGRAVWTIFVADLVMSLDNVLSLAAVARGDWTLLILGLLTSVPIILLGSELLMRLMRRYPAVIFLGGGLLGYVAGDMLLADHAWRSVHWVHDPWIHHALPLVLAILMIGLGLRHANRSS